MAAVELILYRVRVQMVLGGEWRLPCPEVGNGFVFYEKLAFLSAGVGIANDVSVWFLVSLSLTIVIFLSLTIVMLCCLSFQG